MLLMINNIHCPFFAEVSINVQPLLLWINFILIIKIDKYMINDMEER